LERGVELKIHVVIPAFRVDRHIVELLNRIGPEVKKIYVVDDACPNDSGKLVEKSVKDKRVTVIYNSENLGVGGAVIAGYRAALAEGADVIVKLDGDGQMHPEDIPTLVRPLLRGDADYAKGNRFDSLDDLYLMPRIRILGNAVLSLWSKLSSGYWSITDPTNGFTAIHRTALQRVDLAKLARRFFFESDMLFRLNLAGAVVEDVSLPARYGDEKSNLRISKVLLDFPWRFSRNQVKRVFYRYYLREWSIASIELPVGSFLLIFGAWFGLSSFFAAAEAGRETSAGQATISSLAIILGVQLLLSFLSYDIQSEPRVPNQKRYE
jgi:glycosyltransferase involved in cell wall biosynthesis